MNIKKKLRSAGIWLSLTKGADRVVKFIYFTLMIRMLTAEEVGLYGLTITLVQLSNGFTRSGFKEAIIQNEKTDLSVNYTVWLFETVRGTLLFGLIYFSAGLISSFYDANLTSYLRFAALSILITGAINIQCLNFIRKLNYRQNFYYIFTPSLVESSLGIILLFFYPSVWTVLCAYLIRNLTTLILSFSIIKWTGVQSLNVKGAFALTKFSRWIFGANIVFLLSTYVDDLSIGKLINVEALGFYYVAYKYANLGVMEVGNVFKELSFPAISKLQNNMQSAYKLHYALTDVVSGVISLIAGFLIINASEILSLLMGDGWNEVVPVFQILCVGALGRSILGIYGSFFKGIGLPKVSFLFNLIRFITLILFIFMLISEYQLIGVALASMISVLVLYPVAKYLTHAQFKSSGNLIFINEVKNIISVILCTLIVLFIRRFIMVDGILWMLISSLIFVVLFLSFDFFIFNRAKKAGIIVQLSKLL